MSRSAKSVVVKKTIKDPDLIEMFNQMVGASDPDPQIIIPKYENIMKNIKEIIDILDKFAHSPCAQFDRRAFAAIESFVAHAYTTLKTFELQPNDHIISGEEIHKINTDPTKLTEFLMNVHEKYKTSKLGESYTQLKESKVITEMVMLARNLQNVLMIEQTRCRVSTHNFENKDALSDAFIVNSNGDYLQLFNFAPLNFKQLFTFDDVNKDVKQYTLKVLHLIYTRAIEIVHIITSPDIDVAKFSEVLVANIGDMRKHIPRCDKAFDKIEQSVGVLKTNFNEYYKDFIVAQSGNPGIIVENFVMDVARNSKADIQTMRQFKQIIGFYKQKMSNRAISDPRLKKMMDLVGENMSILEGSFDAKRAKVKKEKSGIAESATNETPAENDPSTLSDALTFNDIQLDKNK